MSEGIKYRGKTLEEIKQMDLSEVINLFPARARRSLKRGFTEQQKKLLVKIQKAKQGKFKRQIKTHARDMIVLPEMIDMTIYVYNGKEFIPVTITIEMLGHYLSEFTLTRVRPKHSAPGIGATKSSQAIKKT